MQVGKLSGVGPWTHSNMQPRIANVESRQYRFTEVHPHHCVLLNQLNIII